MKSLQETLKTTLPHDERQDQVREHSSYVALFGLFVVYLGILFYYIAAGTVVPWSTQLLFVAVLGVFAFLTLRGEGAHFSIPGVPETKATLRQPTVLRSLPWTIFFIGVVTSPITIIAAAIANTQGTNPVWTVGGAITAATVFILILLPLYYYVARWIKEGRVVFMVASVLFAVWQLGQMFRLPTAMSLHNISLNLIPLHGIVDLWIIYVLLRYWKQIIADGAAYQKDINSLGLGNGFAWIIKMGPWRMLFSSLVMIIVSFIIIGFTLAHFGHNHPATGIPAALLFLVGVVFLFLTPVSGVMRRRSRRA